MESLNHVQLLAVLALPVLFAITVHEAAHGWVANRLGDRTAYMLGRVTFNPLKHIDPIGTVAVPVLTFLLAGFLFGWAKPVPVNARQLRNPRRDMALVAAAGPGANLLMAIAWGLVIKLSIHLGPAWAEVALFLQYTGAFGVLVNCILMVLNLVPLLPLDGGRVLNALLPRRWSAHYSQLEPYGLLILVLLLASGVLSSVLWPIIEWTMWWLPGGQSAIEILLRLIH